MAAFSATTASKLLFRSKEGTGSNNDQIAIRLAVGATGKLFIERSTKGAPANKNSSFYITEASSYSVTLVAGEEIQALTDTGTLAVVFDASDSGEFGS